MNQLSSSDPVASYGFGLLDQQPPEFDVHELRERLAQSIDVEVVSSSDAIIQLAHPDHTVATTAGVIPSLTNIVRWFNPLQISDFADALDQTWDWPEAESTLAFLGQIDLADVERACRNDLLPGGGHARLLLRPRFLDPFDRREPHHLGAQILIIVAILSWRSIAKAQTKTERRA